MEHHNKQHRENRYSHHQIKIVMNGETASTNQLRRKNVLIVLTALAFVAALACYLGKNGKNPNQFLFQNRPVSLKEITSQKSDTAKIQITQAISTEPPKSLRTSVNSTTVKAVVAPEKSSETLVISPKSRSSILEAIQGGKILAFGDSLTHGLFVDEKTGEWRINHPYANRLRELLNNKTAVVESGINGEMTDSMLRRLPIDISKHNPDIVIILGGTNDLGHGKSADAIFENMKQLHLTALESASASNKTVYTIAIGIPQSGFVLNNKSERSHEAAEKRENINKKLEAFSKQCSSRVLAYLSLEQPFDMRLDENTKYWSSDRLHFSKLGYDKLGEFLFDIISKSQIIPVVVSTGTATTAAAATGAKSLSLCRAPVNSSNVRA